MNSLETPVGPGSSAPPTSARVSGGSCRLQEKIEVTFAVTAVVGIIALRILAAVHYRIDSDETQHLHVVWGWTRGLLQYRDVFDNHAPLFQMLMAPLFSLFPETPESIIWMRLAMIPMFLVAMWSTGRIGEHLFDRRVGIASALIGALIPSYFLCSTEFRTDDLWTVFWLLSIAALVKPRRPRKGNFLAGLFMGAAMATSMKTTLLASCLGIGGLICGAFLLSTGSRFEPKKIAAGLGTASIGFVVLPAAIIGYFACRSALGWLYFGTILHNVRGAAGSPANFSLFAIWTLVAIIAAALVFRFSPSAVRSQRTLIFLTAGIYVTALFTLWPVVEREHFLPFFPLATVVLIGGLFDAVKWIAERVGATIETGANCAFYIALLIAGAEVVVLWRDGQIHRDRTASARAIIRDTLRVTDPEDYVVDQKGETVYRRRAYYFAAEPFTRHQISKRLIQDDTIEQAITKKACVATGDSRNFSDKTRRFLDANYITAGAIRVPGSILSATATAGTTIPFATAFQGRYSIRLGSELAKGVLDGRACEGSAELEPGVHRFTPATDGSNIYVVWSRALDAGLVVQLFEPERKAKPPKPYGKSLGKLLQ